MTATERPAAPPDPVIPPERPWRRGFWSLFATQFQGAFSDNVFKFLVIFIVSAVVSPSARDQYISVVLAVFSLPFILFSMAGGFLADRFPKRNVVIGTKIAEVVIMMIATIGLATRNMPLLITVIFLISTQAAFFGPSKYSLLPEMLPESRLSWGNGLLGLGTFVAIISGGVVAGVLYERLGENQLWSGVLLVLLAGAGTVTSLGILRRPPANPEKSFNVNFLGDLWSNLALIRGDKVLRLAVAGSVYFWFIAALFGEPTIFVYSKDVLQLRETEIALLRACLAIGIGVGSATAGWLSGRKIEYGLIPLGTFGLAACAALLSLPGLTMVPVAVILGALGFSGGFYIVPINALIQHRPDARNKGSVIATNAWLTSVAVFVASGAFWVLRTTLALQPGTIFLVGAVTTFLGSLYAIRLMPDSLLRLVLWIATHSLYRIRVHGREHIPAKGGALFVCNHLSRVDALLLQAAVDRPIRFIMFKGIYDLWYVKPLARVMGTIPISSELRPREMIHSLRTASEAIQNGEIVCIFAEGQITRIGQMLPFRRGFERIMKDVTAPIIPVALDGVWGSIFSFAQGRFVWKLPRRIPYPVTACFGSPLPHTATPFEVRQAVQDLAADGWRFRKPQMLTLPRAFIQTARRHPRRFAMTEARGPALRFGGALVRAVFLARRLKSRWAGQGMVGLLLPPSVGGALANYAALLSGKVPVNLNYTLSEQALVSCARQCNLKTVLTSRAFLEKVKIQAPGEAVFLEDVMDGRAPGVAEKLGAALLAWICPARWLLRLLSGDNGPGARVPSVLVPSVAASSPLDQLATVIFSSGSTGEPKGVMLTHFNIASNVEQLGQTFAFDGHDRFLGILPFFHSFGFMGTLALPAMLGVGVAYHANPLDGKTIGQLVEQYGITFLLSTPTFLQVYLRSCSPEQFGSLRLVLAGAEKMPERVATAFEEQFGIRPVEGYGCTECSPAVAVNTRDFRAAGFRQVGAKRGTIGHPLPGVSVRIVDPGTFERLGVGQPGLLLVRGPNVMAGYLMQPDKTAGAMRDGFYITGDIAVVDEDGFVQITDRLSRFSKIGGEMVPHVKVEETLHDLAGVTEQTFVVAGVPDEKKGERLVVLHTLAADRLKPCLDRLSQTDLPNLWKPRADQFFHVEGFPLLGSGKLDLRRVRELALSRAPTHAG